MDLSLSTSRDEFLSILKHSSYYLNNNIDVNMLLLGFFIISYKNKRIITTMFESYILNLFDLQNMQMQVENIGLYFDGEINLEIDDIFFEAEDLANNSIKEFNLWIGDNSFILYD